jgi:SAM-dependent methyltransferase
MFEREDECWVCGGRDLSRFHEYRFDFHEYSVQDPELDQYTGRTAWLVRCAHCGFGQPECLPTLPRFFDRMYDQRWSPEWVEREFEANQKDFIFRTILRTIERDVPDAARRLLDVGAHAGRFMSLAQSRGWTVEGIELNPATAACAARRTGAPVHRVNAHALGAEGRRYTAVTLTDVLEHIPHPVRLLKTVAPLVEPGGIVAVKVPCGPGQWRKERTLAALCRSHEVSLAGNLVHVNHFSPTSLAMALTRAGFSSVRVGTGAPELLPLEDGRRLRRASSNALRLAVYAGASMPGAVHTPLALNLQAYARRPRP